MKQPSLKVVQKATLFVAAASLLAGSATASAQAQTTPEQPNQMHRVDNGPVQFIDGEFTVPSAGEILSKNVRPDGSTHTKYADGSELATAPLGPMNTFTPEQMARGVAEKLAAGESFEQVQRETR